MATEGIRVTMKKRGINAGLYLMSQQKQAILQKVIVGPDALPYQPFKKYRGSDPAKEPTVTEQRDDQVDYAIARFTEWVRLENKGKMRGILTSQNNVHPVLISEREMARLGQRYNPSLGLLYSTEGPMQEKHQDDEILRTQGRVVQPSRVKNTALGSTGMSK